MVYSMTCLHIHPMMDSSVVSIFWLLGAVLAQTVFKKKVCISKKKKKLHFLLNHSNAGILSEGKNLKYGKIYIIHLFQGYQCNWGKNTD